MNPPHVGWLVFVALIALSAWMYSCGQSMAHRNFRLGYEAGERMRTDRQLALARYMEAYTQGDSIAVPVDTNSDGIWDFVWTPRREGFKRWMDSLRIVELP